MSEVTRRDFLRGAAAGGLALGLSGMAELAAAGEGGRRPNVLLIIDDQHSPRAMGWTGQTQVKTPHLDRLAAGSVRFTNGYCNSPICGPARHSIYTGLHTPSHGVLLNGLPMYDGVETFIAQLNRSGYTTANIGKMHNAPYTHRRDFQFVLNHEFFTSEAGVTHYGPWLRAECAARGIKPPQRPWSRPREGYRNWQEDPERLAHVNWMSEDLTPEYWITDQSLAFIADQKANRPNKPFFLHASYFPPHHPYGPIKKYADMYDASKIKLPPNFSLRGVRQWAKGKNKPRDLDEAGVRRLIAHYFAFTTQLDAQIGRLLDGLAKLGVADNTIVIFTSDHGDMLGEHGRFYKGLMDEGSVGVPFMVRWPGVAKARAERALVSHVDLAPTILSAAGIKPGDKLVGKDLRPLLAGKKWADRGVFSVIHHRMPFSSIMWRRGDYKLSGRPGALRRGGRGGGAGGAKVHYQLFNMAKDPYEQRDLANDPKHAAVLKRMKAELEAYWRPLAKLLPEKRPPTVRTGKHRYTWPADPWNPAKPV